MTEYNEPDFWIPDKPGPCWVCGEETKYAYLDMGYQHDDCDRYPTATGDVLVIRGVQTNLPPCRETQ